MKKQKLQKYTLLTDQIGNGNEDDFLPRFSFEAKSIEEATAKADGWANYQGFLHREVMVRLSNEEESLWNCHNEYVSRFK